MRKKLKRKDNLKSRSKYFVNGRFNNIECSVVEERKLEEVRGFRLMYEAIREKLNDSIKDRLPDRALPTRQYQKANLEEREGIESRITWFGHATVLIEGTRNVLIDPYLKQRRPSPVGVGGPRVIDYERQYTEGDLPDKIDCVLISHNHYDHLDKYSIMSIDYKVEKYYVPLGIKRTLMRWGISEYKIREFNWYEEIYLNNERIKFVFTPALHSSARSLWDFNKSLWGSWVIQLGEERIFYTGDTGYFEEFKKIGEKYGPFDLAIVQVGSYSKRWRRSHMMPEDSIQTMRDIKGERMLPVHWGKVDTSALLDWQQPIEDILDISKKERFEVYTPMVGQSFRVRKCESTRWWDGYGKYTRVEKIQQVIEK